MSQAQFVANGNITTNTFVVVDSSSNNRVINASGTSTPIIGVSQDSANLSPIPNASTLAATAGTPLMVYQEGDICNLQSTSAGWTAGQLLTASAVSATLGFGIAASSGQQCGAEALTTMTGTGLGRVKIVNRIYS